MVRGSAYVAIAFPGRIALISPLLSFASADGKVKIRVFAFCIFTGGFPKKNCLQDNETLIVFNSTVLNSAVLPQINYLHLEELSCILLKFFYCVSLWYHCAKQINRTSCQIQFIK